MLAWVATTDPSRSSFLLRPPCGTPHERDAVRRVIDAFLQTRRDQQEVGDHTERSAPIDELAERRDPDEPQTPTPEQFRRMAAYRIRPEDDERHQREAEWDERGEESQEPGGGGVMGYWPKHPKKELEAVLGESHEAGWSITKGKKCYKLKCPCGNHMRSRHLSPSNPRYAQESLQYLCRYTCCLWEEAP